MPFLPNRGRLFEKLFNNDWIRFFYNEPTETWQEKYRSLISAWWNQHAVLVASKARQLFAHYYIFVIVVAGGLVVLTIHKSRRTNLRTIKYHEKVNSAIRIGEQTCSADEETVIVSEEDCNDQENGTFVKSCPTFPSNLDDPTTARDNDQLDHELSKSSELTVVPDDFRVETGDNFLRKFIDSIVPGHDDEIDESTFFSERSHPDSEASGESILQKVDNKDEQRFYVLTPVVNESKEEWSFEKSNDTKAKIIRTDKLTSNDNALIPSDSRSLELLKETENSKISSSFKELDIDDDIVTTPDSCSASANVNSQSEFHVANHPLKSEQPVDCLEPLINSQHKIKTEDKELIDASDDVPKTTNSKHRFRSLSYDERPISSIANLDKRRGGSASPPLRSKNKLRSPNQGQSRIPTPSPPAFVNHRVLRHYDAIDGSISEASNQIRSALLRKLREVWAQHPRNVIEISSRSKNSSPSTGSSIDSKLLDLGSRIPLPRKFSRGRPSQ